MKDIINKLIPKSLVSISTDIAILGGILTSLGFAFWACVVWTISNPCLVYHNQKINQFEQRNLFIIMTIVSLIGIINLWPF